MASAEKKQTPTFRIFNDDWSMEFFFILRFAKPQCLICHDTVAVIKKTKHIVKKALQVRVYNGVLLQSLDDDCVFVKNAHIARQKHIECKTARKFHVSQAYHIWERENN